MYIHNGILFSHIKEGNPATCNNMDKTRGHDSAVKTKPVMKETQVRSLGQEDPLEEGMATHSGTLPRESHGQRSLAGCSP